MNSQPPPMIVYVSEGELRRRLAVAGRPVAARADRTE